MHPAVLDLFERRKLTLIAGPCVAESEELCLRVATHIKEQAEACGLSFIFKASFDKANRTSIKSYRGPGLEAGLAMLARIKRDLGLPVLTDVHSEEQVAHAARVADVLQIPAFLCRQTDLLVAAAKSRLPVNIKKGQFLAPEDMRHAVGKHREAGGGPVAVTERGATFGYHNLVVDMRGLAIMRAATSAAVVFDATHSVQRPGGGDGVTAGDSAFAPLLARAAAAVGIDGLFVEVHPNPAQALSDGPNSLDFDQLSGMLREVAALDAVHRRFAS